MCEKKYSWQNLRLIDTYTMAIYDILYMEGMGAYQPWYHTILQSVVQKEKYHM